MIGLVLWRFQLFCFCAIVGFNLFLCLGLCIFSRRSLSSCTEYSLMLLVMYTYNESLEMESMDAETRRIEN
jgi:hypothetical protein